jgi:hypothetical protein
MDEQTAFEPRAVLAPRRRRLTRLVPLVPVVALVAIVLAGLAGMRHEPPAVALVEPPAPATAAPAAAATPPEPQFPAEALGFDVVGLGDVRLAPLTRDDVIAIAGWYVPLAITGCPPESLVSSVASATVHPGFDPSAYCQRSGVLYATEPTLNGRATGRRAGATGDGLSSVSATIVKGVVLPADLEVAGADARPVVILGRFVESSTACMLLGACPSELIVDYVAWTP